MGRSVDDPLISACATAGAEIARRTGMDMDEIWRRSFGLYLAAVIHVANGGRVIFEHADGRQKVLKVPLKTPAAEPDAAIRELPNDPAQAGSLFGFVRLLQQKSERHGREHVIRWLREQATAERARGRAQVADFLAMTADASELSEETHGEG